MKKPISIIIRTKNEERWITQVLNAVFNQRYGEFEIIIVDNKSSDKTVEKAEQFDIKKIVTCEEYRPGKALNMGMREAKGEFIVSLSGHCIPVNDRWLENLLKNFADPKIAGVYGRQEAMAFTSDSDKRDLALIFGLDRKVQEKDSFFHNANSMIRKELWQNVPFNDTITNIEDRVWAQEMLKNGYKIAYEPEASVYHYHGIHQNGNTERCTNVVQILESLHDTYEYKTIDMKKLNVVAFVPVRGPVKYLNNKPLLAYTLRRALESKYIKRTIVSTDDKELAALAQRLGAEAPFMRDTSLSEKHVDLATVLRYSLEKTEALKIYPDIVVSVEVTFPFRPKGLLDEMILELARHGFDSVIAAKKENRSIWKQKAGRVFQVDEGITPREFKEPGFIGLKGVACITHPEFLRKGNFLGQKIGIYEVKNPYSHLEVRNEEDFKLASHLINGWFENEKQAGSAKDNIPLRRSGARRV